MRLLLVSLSLLVAGCATPVAPTGGPVDATPPVLVASDPPDVALNVRRPTLRLTFSERLDARSAAQAVRVSPLSEEAPEVRVRGLDLEVVLPGLRDSTTYVVTIGTDLQDARNVPLQSPITLAFSTGPTIDRGRIEGTVAQPTSGDGEAGLAVWAYRRADSTAGPPDVSTLRPDYQTETDAQGAFRLDYLRPGSYFVAAVADANRNGRPDAGERFAAPPRPTVRADSAGRSALRLWATALDSVPPRANRVRALSDRRLAVRFSEPVRLADDASQAWAVADSVSGREVRVAAVYTDPAVPAEVVLLTEAPLPPIRQRLRMDPPAVVDTAGNAAAPFALGVTPPARADTVEARFLGFAPEAPPDSVRTLTPHEAPTLRFSAPPDSGVFRVAITASGVTRPLPFQTGTALTVDVPPAFETFAITVSGPDTTRTAQYRRLPAADLGMIVGEVPEAVSGLPVVVEASRGGERIQADAAPDGRFTISGLRPGPYRLRLFADPDGDGRWSGGSLVPYRPPEPLLLLAAPVEARARWETDVPASDWTAPAAR